MPRFAMPPEARVFARERWTGAPVLAGYRRGAGAVLWVAASPGEHGYERFPYLLHALADLGLEAAVPLRAAVGVLRLLPIARASIWITSRPAGAPPASQRCTSPPGTSTSRTRSATRISTI